MKRLFLVICVFSCLISAHLFAGSATWNLSPTIGDWNTAANWTPNTVPNGPGDTATFASSGITTLSLSAPVEVSEIIFDPDADPYTINVPSNLKLIVSGAGVTGDSRLTQTLVAQAPLTSSSLGGAIQFFNSATLARNTLIKAEGSPFLAMLGGEIDFFDRSSAGGGMIINQAGSFNNSLTIFHDQATAGHAVLINEGDTTGHLNARGGEIFFQDDSSAFKAVITNNGGSDSNALGGYIEFDGRATAGRSIITNTRGVGAGSPAEVLFTTSSTADMSTLIADGGIIGLNDDSDGDRSQIELLNDGLLTLALHRSPGSQIGSLEGDSGTVVLGRGNLSIGANDLSTTYGGKIVDLLTGRGRGSITKIGLGTLTLTGANSYSNGTTKEDGALVIDNTGGSGTGRGPVQSNIGLVGGSGTIAGAVTMGSGSGTGSILFPSTGTQDATTLTIQSSLTFKSDGAYFCRPDTRNAHTDLVVANGVTIEDGAAFLFHPVKNDALPIGTVITIFSNTSAAPIVGSFVGYPEGAIFSFGRNTYQLTYSGGDGNDLTLTVVP
jgi:autotransporter-associated beta strand protein